MALSNGRMFNNGCRPPSPAMSDYLDRIGAGLVIADTEPFNFDFLPPELVMRDEEMSQFAKNDECGDKSERQFHRYCNRLCRNRKISDGEALL